MRGADELLRHEVQPHERRAVRHHLLLLLAPRLDVPPLPRRHEPDEPRALPLRDPSRNGLRILALLLRNGRGDRVRRRHLRRALRPLAPRHRAGARQRLEKGHLARPVRARGKTTARARNSRCELGRDGTQDGTRRAGARRRPASTRYTERTTNVVTTLPPPPTLLPNRARGHPLPFHRRDPCGVIFVPLRERPATGRCCTSPPSPRG